MLTLIHGQLMTNITRNALISLALAYPTLHQSEHEVRFLTPEGEVFCVVSPLGGFDCREVLRGTFTC